jgi:polar amino acid transport system substrate-binding protein
VSAGRPSARRAARGRLALLVVAAAVVLGACGSTPSISTQPAKPLVVRPKGAEIVHPVPAPATAENCNATASLPPLSPMPTPGAMPAGTTMAQIQARGHLNVGVDQNTYLWGYRDPVTGQLSGFDIGLLQQVAQAIFGPSYQSHINYVVINNTQRIPAVNSRKVDMVAFTMTVNCEREEKTKTSTSSTCCVDFSSVYYQAGQSILVPSNSTITSYHDLGGKRVCTIAGSTSETNLVGPTMPKHIQIWAVPGPTDCLVMLEQHQVDAISTDDAILYGLQAQDPNTMLVGEPFTAEPYGIAISQATPDLTRFVNGVLAQVRTDGAWTSLFGTYLAKHVPAGSSEATPPTPTYK